MLLTKQERDHLEISLIASLFNSDYCISELLKIKNNESLFSNEIHKLIFTKIIKYYFEQHHAPVSATQIFEICLLEDKKIPANVVSQISQIEITSDVAKIADKLIEGNLDVAVKNIEKSANDKKLMGYERVNYFISELTKVKLKTEGIFDREISNIDSTENLLQKINKIRNGEFVKEYLPTGIESLDRKIIGIPKKHLTIIAARPGMGKTAFMLQLMRNLLQQGLKVGVISLEMDLESLLLRNLSAYASIDSMKIENGSIDNDEFQYLVKSSKNLIKENYVIDDSGYQSIETIKARIMGWKLKNKIDVIFVDYLTLISTKNKNQRFDLQIGELTNELRIFSKETEIPIVILSQLNRAVDSRTNKRPMLSDLRESGSIEQDAKVVLFLHRPVIYGEENFKDGHRFVDENGNDISIDEYAECIVSKSRNGALGTVPLRYIPKFHQFKSANKVGGNVSNARVHDEYEGKGWAEEELPI